MLIRDYLTMSRSQRDNYVLCLSPPKRRKFKAELRKSHKLLIRLFLRAKWEIDNA